MNAFRLAHACSRSADDRSRAVVGRAVQDGAIHVYERSGESRERVLYTTLEPCTMCTVCLINAGVDRVVIGAADPPSGTLEARRLARLPALWPQLAGDLEVVFCQTTEPDAPASYLPPGLQDELLGRFARSREQLDDQLGAKGVLDFADAAANARRIARSA